MRSVDGKMMYSKNGKSTAPVMTAGTIMFKVYVTKDSWNAPDNTRLVGFEDTRMAEAMLRLHQ